MELKDIALPLYQAKGWMRFFGVTLILEGTLCALTIVGLLYAWLPIWRGVLLFQASSRIEHAYEGGGAVSFMESLHRLKTYFIVQGVTVLVFLIFIGLAVATGLLGAIAAALL